MSPSDVFGVIQFDDPRSASEGWAGYPGQDPVRFTSTNELDSNKVHWTNLKHQSSPTSRLKGASFLPPGMTAVARELAIHEDPAEAQCVVLAELFARVMRLAMERYDVQAHNLCFGLDEALQNKLLAPEKNEVLEKIQKNAVFRSCHINWVDCETPTSAAQTQRVSVVIPRVQRTLTVLSSPVPNDYWSFVPNASMMAHDARFEWLKNVDQPSLAEVSHVHIMDEAVGLFPSKFRDEDASNWVALPELIALSQFGTFQINNVFLGGTYHDLKTDHPFTLENEFDVLSLSSGYLANAYLNALCLPSPVIGNKAGETFFSPQAIWISAIDRSMTLAMALSLHASGLAVVGYGSGRIELMLDDSQLEELIIHTRRLGLCVPVDLEHEFRTLKVKTA